MRAAIYREFGGPITVERVADPVPANAGAVLAVRASGVCRSDVRGWLGDDPDIVLPHVPGHELCGTVVAVGRDVVRAAVGDRVTIPFCGGCGTCPTCRGGNTQICDRATQPGFTGWGSFAEYVAVEHADVNLVAVPDDVDDAAAALLGCRLITAYRAVVDRAAVQPGGWLAVHGCGGLGLSAVMIGVAVGVRVVAVDVDPAALARAAAHGADVTIDASAAGDVAEAVRDATGGGADASIDAYGSAATAGNSIRGLRKLGRHVQAGLFHGDATAIPMNTVVGRELEILGTHGMAAHRIPELLELVRSGAIDPASVVTRTIGIDDVPAALRAMRDSTASGAALVTTFT